MSEKMHEGGCGCGTLRYRVAGTPIVINNCHCTLCQHQTGSTSVVNAFFETERFTLLSGTLKDHVVAGGSGKPHVIRRCSACGTAILSHYARLGTLGLGLRVGTLDDPGSFRPDAVIFVAEAMPWVALPEGIPAFETTYDFRKVLPPERMVRMNALVERRKAGEG